MDETIERELYCSTCGVVHTVSLRDLVWVYTDDDGSVAYECPECASGLLVITDK